MYQSLFKTLIISFLVFFSAGRSQKISESDVIEFVRTLWKLEKTQSGSVRDYALNFQGYVNNQNPNADMAPQPLFANLNALALQSKISTIPAFLRLLDNYKATLGEPETVSIEEQNEIRAFIQAIKKTDVMKQTHKFLVQKGVVDANDAKFWEYFTGLWFGLYKRRRPNDSSAFEHVFVGEKKDGEVSGFHNWIQFYRLENGGVLNYHGYYAKHCGEPPRLVTLSFRMKDGSMKPRGSLLIGTSPEFELALYTVVFLSGHSQITVHLDTCKATVICHPIHYGKYIGTCYIK